MIEQIQKLTAIPWDDVQVRNPTLDDDGKADNIAAKLSTP